MIPTTLHLIACIALVMASIHWRSRSDGGDSIYRRMRPFVFAAGFFGLLVLYGPLMELFVVYYSGAIYETGALTRWQLAWIAVYMTLTLLPLAGLVPVVGRRSLPLIVIGLLAAVPDVVALTWR